MIRPVFVFIYLCYTCCGIQAQAIDSAGNFVPIEEIQADPANAETTPPIVKEPLPLPAPVSPRQIEQDKWDKASNTLDYSQDVPNPRRQRSTANPGSSLPNLPNFDVSGWGDFLKYVLIGLLLLAVGFGIYKLIQQPRDRAIYANDGTPITLENLEAYIHETDLERFLREALEKGDYPQAVRIYYLQVIKDLSGKGLLRWSREKTNRDYLTDLRKHALEGDFRFATATFEQVWYGNAVLNLARYTRIEGDMKGLLSEIGKLQ